MAPTQSCRAVTHHAQATRMNAHVLPLVPRSYRAVQPTAIIIFIVGSWRSLPTHKFKRGGI